MQDISINNYNEMLRYERDMDLLRALALYAASSNALTPIPGFPEPREYIFDVIGYYSAKFANDIYGSSSISTQTIDTFHSALYTFNHNLGITEVDIASAHEMQRYLNSGFWEMRRCISQFPDIAEYALSDGINHIVTAAVSGCIIGEYLALVMSKQYGKSIPVDHMIFERESSNPVAGLLSSRVQLHSNILLVDDAIMETVTAEVMIRDVQKLRPDADLSVFVIDIEPEVKYSRYLSKFKHVYMPEE